MYSLLSTLSRCRLFRWLAIVVLPLATHAAGITVQSALVAETHEATGSSRISLMRTDVGDSDNTAIAEPSPLMRTDAGDSDNAAFAERSQKNQIQLLEPPKMNSVKRLLLRMKSDADAMVLMARRQLRGFQGSKRDDRALFVYYTDELCEKPMSDGFYLPFDASLGNGKCAKVEHKDVALAAKDAAANANRSMRFKCKPDGSAMTITMHNNNDCTGVGKDDTFQGKVDAKNFESFTGSTCTRVLNEQTVEVEYVKLHSETHIVEWPECVKGGYCIGTHCFQLREILAACGAAGIVIIIVYLWWKYRAWKKRKDKERQMMMGKGFDFKGKGFDFKGKGKGKDMMMKGKDGKGKDMMMMGKGMDFKGKDMKGKAEKGKGGKPTEFIDIKLTIVKAEELQGADGNHKSDPYVECHLNEPNAWAPPFFKTNVKKKTVSPEWKESTEFRGFASGSWITFMVKDKNLGDKPDTELGKAILDYVKMKESGFDGDLEVEQGGVQQGKLTVKVELIFGESKDDDGNDGKKEKKDKKKKKDKS